MTNLLKSLDEMTHCMCHDKAIDVCYEEFSRISD